MKKLMLFAMLLCAGVARADVKIAVVDVDLALKDSPQVTAMQSSMKKAFEPKQDKIAHMRSDLKEAMDAVRRNESVMKASELKAKKAKIDSDLKELQKMESDFQQALYVMRAEKLKDLQAAFQVAVKQVAQKQSIDLVVNKSSEVYSHNINDITQAVADVLKHA